MFHTVPTSLKSCTDDIRHLLQNDQSGFLITGQLTQMDTDLGQEFGNYVAASTIMMGELFDQIPSTTDRAEANLAAEQLAVAAMFEVFLRRHPEVLGPIIRHHMKCEQESNDIMTSITGAQR